MGCVCVVYMEGWGEREGVYVWVEWVGVCRCVGGVEHVCFLVCAII